MKKFDRRVILFLIIVLLLALILILQGDRVGVQINAVIPAEGERVGAYGPIGIRFNEEMDQDSVESHFSITPAIKGTFSWEGDTLWFFPRLPFVQSQTYQVTLDSGSKSVENRELLKSMVWTVEVRSPDIVYLVLDDTGGDLWRYDLQSETTHELTKTEGKVIDFSPSLSGNLIAYAANNTLGGSDLWVIDRGGSSASKLLTCDEDRCSQPVWRNNEQIIAYSREPYNSDSNQYLPSRIWTVNTKTSATNSLYQQETAYGDTPSFSPDGKYLASYDLTQNAIRILDLDTSQESLLPSTIQRMGDWSVNSDAMIFTELIPSILEPEVIVYVANLEDQSINQVLTIIDSTDFSQPRWSPDDDWMAVSLRPVNAPVSKALWVFRLDGTQSIEIADEPSATFSAYRWDPWGSRLVYQRVALGSSAPLTSIWLWDWKAMERELIIQNGARPEWLP